MGSAVLVLHALVAVDVQKGSSSRNHLTGQLS